MSPIPITRIDFGAILLRVSLGTMWIAHALMKYIVFTLPGFSQWLEGQGLPGVMAWPVVLMEITGGTAIILGFHGRYVSLILLPVLLVATSTHIPNGWLFTNTGGGWEYPVFLIMASLCHALIGDGRLATSNLKTGSANIAAKPVTTEP